MIVYAVTLRVDPAVADEFVEYLRRTHVPDVLATGCFVGHEILRVTDPPDAGDDRGRTTYCVQYRVRSRANLDRYLADHAPALRKEVADRFGDKFAASRFVAEVMM
jgi:hypothetical protein